MQNPSGISHGAIMPLIEEKVAAKWYAFGLLLGVPKDTLDSIARGYVASCGNTKYALSEVVRDWLEDKHTQESSKPKSWSSLQEVVGKMGYHKLAGDIGNVGYNNYCHNCFFLVSL